jgi:hypothetical protein
MNRRASRIAMYAGLIVIVLLVAILYFSGHH